MWKKQNRSRRESLFIPLLLLARSLSCYLVPTMSDNSAALASNLFFSLSLSFYIFSSSSFLFLTLAARVENESSVNYRRARVCAFFGEDDNRPAINHSFALPFAEALRRSFCHHFGKFLIYTRISLSPLPPSSFVISAILYSPFDQRIFLCLQRREIIEKEV